MFRLGQSGAGRTDSAGIMQRCKRINATLRKRRADSPEIKMRRDMEEPARREIRMQLGQESLKLSFDTLEPEERTLAEMIRPDKEQLLLREIQLLAVRERRMLKRIQSLRELEAQTGSEEDPVPSGMSVTEYTSGIEKGKLTELRKYEGILGQIQAIEDALTRVQARQQKAIEMLHKFGYDDAKLELATMQLEFEMLKQDNQAEEATDDGFLEAMNATAQDVWGDENV